MASEPVAIPVPTKQSIFLQKKETYFLNRAWTKVMKKQVSRRTGQEVGAVAGLLKLNMALVNLENRSINLASRKH